MLSDGDVTQAALRSHFSRGLDYTVDQVTGSLTDLTSHCAVWAAPYHLFCLVLKHASPNLILWRANLGLWLRTTLVLTTSPRSEVAQIMCGGVAPAPFFFSNGGVILWVSFCRGFAPWMRAMTGVSCCSHWYGEAQLLFSPSRLSWRRQTVLGKGLNASHIYIGTICPYICWRYCGSIRRLLIESKVEYTFWCA